MRFLFAFALVGSAIGYARGADPVTVELAPTATVGATLVTVGDVATVTGGTAADRARALALDLTELKARDAAATVGKRNVEYRLALAGIEARVTGAERTTVSISRRAVTAEEVTAAARTELLRQYTEGAVTVELATPVAVKLPDVPLTERVVITAKPRGRAGATGRVHVDMTVAAGNETLLSFAVNFDVQPRGAVPAGATQFASAELLIRPRQRVQIQVNTGGLKVAVVGEAQQGGKLGQTILVQNIDSKKTVSARVTGPGTVEIDLGGAP